MNEIYFTSDTHWGHANVIRFCDRPYSSVEEMNEAMIEMWNNTVRHKSDTVYHNGDFSFASAKDTEGIIKRLRGQIHIMWGNHDEHLRRRVAYLFNSVQDVKEIKVRGQRIFLSHYAHRVWNHSHHGSWHLYGHSHGSLPDDPNALSMDVGVDANHMQLVSFDQVGDHMATKTFVPIDHHGDPARS